MKNKVFYFLALLVSVSVDISALIIGSDTEVSVEASVEFPEKEGLGVPADNQILSFAWMKNGFDLENSSTTLSFKSLFPVQGTINLSGGMLTLDEDLIFKNSTTLSSWGTVEGNGHVLRFCSSIGMLPSSADSFENVDLFFDEDLTINSTVTFKGSSLIGGNTNPLILGSNGEIIVDSGATLHMRDMEVIGLKNSNIRCADDTACLILDNVNWVLDDSLTFDTGSITFADRVSFSGTGTFFYTSSQTSTINTDALWKLTDNLSLKIGRDSINLNNHLYFTNETATLELDNVDFITSDSGIQIINGTVVFNRSVHLDTIYTDTQRGMILGDGNSAHDIHIRLNPGCSIVHNSGYWTYANGDSDGFQANTLSSSLVRKDGSLIAIHTDLMLPKQTVEVASNAVTPISVADNVTLSYQDTRIVLPDIEFIITGNQFNAFGYELNGNDELFFTKGSMPLATQITGSGNVIKGNGGISGSITLSNSAAALGLGIIGELRNLLTLNNGTVTLLDPLVMNNDGTIAGPGTVNLSSYVLALSPQQNSWTTSIQWQSADGIIMIPTELSLSETWTFQGDVLLDGKGNTLRLKDNGKFFLLSDAHLTLKDIIIDGVGDNTIACEDDTCHISFLRASWILVNDITITHGSIDFENANTISGPYTLTFDQPLTNTIKANSQCALDLGLTFSFGRSVDGHEPLYFADDTAQLKLDNASIGIKKNGATLSRGTMICSKKCTFDFNSTHTANGLQVGTGAATGDFTIRLNPASSVALGTGHLLQNIIDIEKGFVGLSTSAKLSFPASGLTTHYVQNGKLANISIETAGLTTVTFSPGVNVYLENVLGKTPTGNFLVNVRRYAPFVLALDGAPHSVEIISGTYPHPIVVSGTGNVIKGLGLMTGAITFLASSAELQFDMLGILDVAPTLNNGTIILNSSLQLGSDKTITGPGTINLNGNSLDVGDANTTWSTPLRYQGSSGIVALHANTELATTWTFEGACILKGNDYTLTFLDEGEIFIAPDSSLHLENIKLAGASGNAFNGQDDDSVLILDNVLFEADQTITFTKGAIRFIKDTQFSGRGMFVYESTQTSTIHADAKVKLDSNFTFSYVPANDNAQLIEFEDTTSQLVCKGGLLYVGSGGLELTKGLLLVKENSYIASDLVTDSDGNTSGQGITFGNEVSASDCAITIFPGFTLSCAKGLVKYKNVKGSSLVFEDHFSALHFLSGTQLWLYQNITASPGRIIFEDMSKLVRVLGKNITGSIVPRGTLQRESIRSGGG